MIGKPKPLSIFRFVLQAAFFFLLPGLFILVLAGIKQLYLATIHGSFSIYLLPQLMAAIAVIPFILLLGRFFCGWMCAFGSLSDFLYSLRRLIFRRKLFISEKADRLLKSIKHLVLAVSVVLIWTLGIESLNIISPWDAFAQLPSVSSAVSLYATGSLVLLSVIVASLFIERFFCRYLCPLGAIFSVISRFKIVGIRKPTEKCGKCRICTQSCPMSVPLYQSSQSRSGECIGCMKCIQACPRKNVSLTVSNESIQPTLASSIAVGAIMGLYGLQTLASPSLLSAGAATQSISSSSTGSTSSNDSSSFAESPASSALAESSSSVPSSSSSSSSSSVLEGKYIDGTYSGTGTGYRPELHVTVTVAGGKISKIEIGSNNETPSFASVPFRIIPQAIIDSQSTQVDAISGATRTSRGIMTAVSNALKDAVAK